MKKQNLVFWGFLFFVGAGLGPALSDSLPPGARTSLPNDAELSQAIEEAKKEMNSLMINRTPLAEGGFKFFDAPGPDHSGAINGLWTQMEEQMGGGKISPIPLQDKPGVAVLISSSMNKEDLVRLLYDAHAVGAPVYLRGLVNNDMRETVRWIMSMKKELEEIGSGIGISVDPTLFSEFGIDRVPAFVFLLNPSARRCDAENSGEFTSGPESVCPESRGAYVLGDVTLSYALEHISNKASDPEVRAAAASFASQKK